jgi:putative tryptophan/tyrosine transport system substrate-binding protein
MRECSIEDIEGKNITIETRYAQDNFDRLPELARELVRLDVDLLFVSGDQGVKAAKEATDTIPILVAACDPLERLVVSIARPAGKVTGATCISSELSGKRLQILRELIPALARVAVLYNPDDSEQVIRIQGSASGSAQHEPDCAPSKRIHQARSMRPL